jgi:hypothetical protein
MIRCDARLELDLPLAKPDRALAALLRGEMPAPLPAHPLFRHPAAALLLCGESLDHATTGSRVVRTAEGGLRLIASASLPGDAAFLEAALDWLSTQVAAPEGELLGFVVPPGASRHDMRLLAWHGERLRPLPPAPEGALGCSLEGFAQAAGLPMPVEANADLAAAIRLVAQAVAAGRALPVAQARLDGPLLLGQATFLAWLMLAAEVQHGFTTRLPPLFVQ